MDTTGSWPIWLALGNAAAMIGSAVFVFFFHDRRHEDIEQWVDFAFSAHMLGRMLVYYRAIGVLMGVFFVLFVLNLVQLQDVSGVRLFAEGQGSLLAITMFAFDLVLRGALFDWMEHFDWSVSPLSMNRETFWLVIYAFVFRMFYALTLLKILVSFAWIRGKIRLTHGTAGGQASDSGAGV